jgi:hypothetical protein
MIVDRMKKSSMGRVVKTKDNFRNRSKVNTHYYDLRRDTDQSKQQTVLARKKMRVFKGKEQRHRSIIEDRL